MRQHQIPGDPGLKQKPKRVGRGVGSGNGKTAGRGHKGQQARSGGKHQQPAFEGGQTPMTRRLPKRGFSNKRFGTIHSVVNLSDLNTFPDGGTVDVETMKSRKMVRKHRPVKILAKGDLSAKNLTVQAHAFSGTAREKIEAAGGTCVIVKE